MLFSNKGPTDDDPSKPQPTQLAPQSHLIRYPWIPGRWHSLIIALPNNKSVDLDQLVRDWHSQRWIEAGLGADQVKTSLVYFFPWWCGWGYWWWWWWGSDCTDIGVGEGESVDVEQIRHVRVFMPTWPPLELMQ